MRANRHWLALSLLLPAVGAGLFAHKVIDLGYPIRPQTDDSVWIVQARIKLEPESGPVTVSLKLPATTPGYARLDESFVSRGFGKAVVERNGLRMAEWTIRRLNRPQTLYYRATVFRDPKRPGWTDVPDYPDPPQLEEPFATALRAVVDEVRATSADIESFALRTLERVNHPEQDENMHLLAGAVEGDDAKVRLLRQILAGARIPTRAVHGIRLDEDRKGAIQETWLAVHNERQWLYFDPDSGDPGRPDDLFFWYRGSGPAASVRGATLSDLQFSVRRHPMAALDLAEERARQRQSPLAALSLFRLPVETQDVYSVLLMVPLGALIIVVLRNLVGVRTFGTFMPVLIAIAFRDTGLLAGVLMFALVISIGLLIRFYLEHLRLLLVPRLAAVLTIVVLLMVVISLVSEALNLNVGLSVALFPMVIMAMTIERMSIVWEERGPYEAIRDGIGSLAVAALAFLVMDHEALKHLLFVFPELTLVVLGMVLLLGRYTGYRLSELGRFRKVVDFSGSRVDESH